MHTKRWITGLVAAPFLVFLILIWDQNIFSLVLSVVSVLTLMEYNKVAFSGVDEKKPWYFNGLPLVFSPIILFGANALGLGGAVGVLLAGFFVSAVVCFFVYKTNPKAPDLLFRQFVGTLYIPFLLSLLVVSRAGDAGPKWILLTVCLVFSNDIGALYFGTYFGKHKLCPWVSPGKTIEGSLGGLLSAMVIGLGLKFFLFQGLAWSGFVLFFVLAAVIGQVGDLFESMLKRSADIKDSGGLLPGHGGFLDRIDALLFVSPLSCFFKDFLL